MVDTSPYIRIVCEGFRTEPNYLNGWLRANNYVAANPAFKAKDNSPRGVVKEAKKVFKEARHMKIPAEKIHVWAVFDRDGHPGIPEAINEASECNIGYAFSNVCFEFWILLHYARITQPFTDCDEIIDTIKKYHDADYGKSNDHYDRLKDKTDAAIHNGKWLLETHWQYDDRPVWEKNPFSNVHKMLEDLKKIL